jgi:hypothetical protein
MSDMGTPSLSTIKTLFALSCNRCAYPGCEQSLTDPTWGQVNADIAHIRGDRPGSARYDETMSDDDRHAYDNLLLVCPNHHRLIDRLDPDGHPVERLRKIKHDAESQCADHRWTDDATLERAATLLLHATMLAEPSQPADRPRLVVRKVKDRIEVRNIGDGEAFNIVVEPIDDKTREATVLGDIPPERLSAGASWGAGFHAATMGNAGPHVIRLRWVGANGTAYDGEFPL